MAFSTRFSMSPSAACTVSLRFSGTTCSSFFTALTPETPFAISSAAAFASFVGTMPKSVTRAVRVDVDVEAGHAAVRHQLQLRRRRDVPVGHRLLRLSAVRPFLVAVAVDLGVAHLVGALDLAFATRRTPGTRAPCGLDTARR